MKHAFSTAKHKLDRKSSINNRAAKAVTFEVIPPPVTWNEQKTVMYCEEVVELLRQQGVTSVCIPEVINEARGDERSIDFVPKLDTLQFALLLKGRYQALEPIVCKICVRNSKTIFAQWLEKVYSNGIKQLVLVGGEHSEIQYPGYSVIEAAQYIKDRYPDIYLGGITIFTRPKEAERIVKKMDSGIEFFFSQIIFEAANLKQVILNLKRLCQNKNIGLPKLLLSVTLASKIKDIEFMKWLGVEFPSAIYCYLTEKNELSLEARSADVLNMLLDEVFHFIEMEKIDMGFNIEHIMYTNLFLMKKAFENIKTRVLSNEYLTSRLIPTE